MSYSAIAQRGTNVSQEPDTSILRAKYEGIMFL
jgi:hypothetical protein